MGVINFNEPAASFKVIFLYLRPLEDLPQLIHALQARCGFKMPISVDDYYEVPRTEIDVRREMVATDGLKAVTKRRFNPAALLKVSFYSLNGVCGFISWVTFRYALSESRLLTREVPLGSFGDF